MTLIPHSAQRTKKAIEADGQDCLTLPLDIMEAENCQAIIDEHLKKYGALDVLVNNASKQIMSSSIEEIDVGPPERWLGWILIVMVRLVGRCGEYIPE